MTAVMARAGPGHEDRAVRIAPYRLLFPAGLAFALAGGLVWPLQALGLLAWPGPLHRALMTEGFELSFIAGFLLTAMSGLLHGERCRPAELMAVFAAVLAFALACAAGALAAAHAAFTTALLVVAFALSRRLRAARMAPPTELAFVALGLAHGVAGGVLGTLAAAGLAHEPSPGFATRLVSLGMVLPIALGVGSLIVPVFAGVSGPLALPGIAGPHERRRRGAFHLALGTVLVLATAADAAGHATGAAWLRVVAAAPVLIGGWKSFRRPRAGALPLALRAAGVAVLGGLLLAAALPAHPLAGEHLVYIGGYGLLTLAVATRVTMAHGGFGIQREDAMLAPWPATLVFAALATRLVADWRPAWIAGAGALWVAAWVWWAAGVLPRWLRLAPAPAPPRLPVGDSVPPAVVRLAPAPGGRGPGGGRETRGSNG
jgi:uncharacterized protein involved in response to NO